MCAAMEAIVSVTMRMLLKYCLYGSILWLGNYIVDT